MIVLSAYRSPEHNRAVGGAEASKHMEGIAFDVAKGVQIFARAANAFDERYQDALGYRTEGRSIHGGIRLAGGG